MKLNWPLVVMWWPVASLVERFTTNMNPSATHDIWVMVYVLAILFSVAIFWYFVIVEIEARKRGGSVVRFQNALGEVAKIVFLLVSGVAAPVYAYAWGFGTPPNRRALKARSSLLCNCAKSHHSSFREAIAWT